MQDDTPPPDLVAHAAFVRRLAGCLLRDGDEADDAAQETLARALERPPRRPGVRAWLAAILRNVVRRRRRDVVRLDRRERIAARPEAMAGEGDRAGHREILRSVVEAIESLDAPSREVILLRHYEDLPPRRIAERLGIPVETVKSRLKRAHERLRDSLDERRGGNVEGWRSALAVLVGIGVMEAAAKSAAAASTEGGVAMGTSSKIALAVAAAALLAGAVFLLAPRAKDGKEDLPSDRHDAVAAPVLENPTSPRLAVAPRAVPPVAPPPVAGGSSDDAALAVPPADASDVIVRIRLGPTDVVSLDADGKGWGEIGALEDVEPAVQDATLALLRERLEAAAHDPTQREADGTSTLRAVLEPDATSRWKHVQWVLQTLANPNVNVRRVRYVAPGGGASIDQDLPKDRGALTPDAAPEPVKPPPSVRIALFRIDAGDAEKAKTKIRIAITEMLVAAADGPEARAQSWATLRERLAVLQAADARLTAEIDAPPPKGGLVPYADVYEVLSAARAAGITEVSFQGAPSPLPRTTPPPK